MFMTNRIESQLFLNAAAKILIQLAQRYGLPIDIFDTEAYTSSSKKYSALPEAKKAEIEETQSIILNHNYLSMTARTIIQHYLDKDKQQESAFTCTLYHQDLGKWFPDKRNFPAKLVLFLIFKAINERTQESWPGQESRTEAMHQERLQLFYFLINTVFDNLAYRDFKQGIYHKFALCLQLLNGYAGICLPQTQSDVIRQGLQEAFKQRLNVFLPQLPETYKDPTRDALHAFSIFFQHHYLPWINKKILSPTLEQLVNNLGSASTPLSQPFIEQYRRHKLPFGPIADNTSTSYKIGYRSCSNSLADQKLVAQTPSSSIFQISPFISILTEWLSKKHQDPLSRQLRDWCINADEGLINWLALSPFPSHSGLDIAYLLIRLSLIIHDNPIRPFLLSCIDWPEKEKYRHSLEWINALIDQFVTSFESLTEQLEQIDPTELEYHLMTLEEGDRQLQQQEQTSFVIHSLSYGYYDGWFNARTPALFLPELVSHLQVDKQHLINNNEKLCTIFMPDEAIDAIQAVTFSEQMSVLEWYVINRTLLHAFCFPTRWSPLFEAHLNKVITYLEESDSSLTVQNQALFQPFAPYKFFLLDQLKALKSARAGEPYQPNHGPIFYTPELLRYRSSICVHEAIRVTSELSDDQLLWVYSSQESLDEKQQKILLNELMHVCVQQNRLKLIGLLINNELCDVNAVKNSSHSPMDEAIRASNLEMVRILLQSDRLVLNICESETPLITAMKQVKSNPTEENKSICRLLIQATKADLLNYQDKNGQTAIQHAIETQNIEIISLLLQRTDLAVNQQDNDGDTPLINAVLSGNVQTVDLLLKQQNCAINHPDKKGMTALHHAVEMNNPELIALVLKHKEINVNLGDSNGNTPLHIAIRYSSEASIRALLNNKTLNVNQQNNKGESPALNLFKRDDNKKSDSILKLLRQIPNIEIRGQLNSFDIHPLDAHFSKRHSQKVNQLYLHFNYPDYFNPKETSYGFFASATSKNLILKTINELAICCNSYCGQNEHEGESKQYDDWEAVDRFTVQALKSYNPADFNLDKILETASPVLENYITDVLSKMGFDSIQLRNEQKQLSDVF